MKKMIYCFMAMLCLWTSGATMPQPVTPGQPVPDLRFDSLLYRPTGMPLSVFGDKLVVLDFWATWCGSCLLEMPRLDSLQGQMPGQLVIIAVTDEPVAKVEAFFARHPRLRPNHMLVQAGDSSFSRLFPHNSIPHEVWLHSGKLYAETSPRFLTAASVNACLAGQPYTGTVKADLGIDKRKLFLAQGNPEINRRLVMQSTLLHALPEQLSASLIQHAGSYDRYAFINLSLPDILARLVVDLLYLKRRVVTAGVDANPYQEPSAGVADWLNAYGYNYEILVPAGTDPNKAHALALSDLESKLGIVVSREMRPTPCYAVSNAAGPPAAVVLTATQLTSLAMEDAEGQPAKGNIQQLLRVLNNEAFGGAFPLPFVNRLTDPDRLYLLPEASRFQDVPQLLSFLQTQGIHISQVSQPLEHLVVRPALH